MESTYNEPSASSDTSDDFVNDQSQITLDHDINKMPKKNEPVWDTDMPKDDTNECEIQPNEEIENDDVKSVSPAPKPVEKVVQEKLVYYCSSFDLNVNEWFTEYENTQIFKNRMKKKLG